MEATNLTRAPAACRSRGLSPFAWPEPKRHTRLNLDLTNWLIQGPRRPLERMQRTRSQFNHSFPSILCSQFAPLPLSAPLASCPPRERLQTGATKVKRLMPFPHRNLRWLDKENELIRHSFRASSSFKVTHYASGAGNGLVVFHYRTLWLADERAN